MIGRIVKIAGRTYEVRTPDGRLKCVFRGRAKKERLKVIRLAAVGDDVEVTPVGANEGVIEAVLPRRTKLSRAHPSNRRLEQVIVANVDLLAIVQAARQPDLDLLTIDLLTVMAQAAGLASALVVNKSELGPAKEADLYRRLGIPVLRTSAARREGLEELSRLLSGRTTVLLGPSGVGKSSLVNALRPDLSVAVGGVSEKTGGGRHTTTWVELLEVSPGTYVVDTPGLEVFSFWDVRLANLRDFLPEFVAVADGCRFRDCVHLTEPHCAVREAVEAGRIFRSRYEDYRTIRHLLAERKELFDPVTRGRPDRPRPSGSGEAAT